MRSGAGLRDGRPEGVGRRRRKRHARQGPTQARLGGRRARAERTRNMAFMLVTLEVSRLSSWLNADAPCRVERRSMRCGARCAPGGGRAWGGGGASGMHGDGPTQGLGARARAERTQNMAYMLVTLDVSQLEMFALKLFKLLKRWLMSVIIETSQPAMEPYVSVAVVGKALYHNIAVFREALVVKVPEVAPISAGIHHGA